MIITPIQLMQMTRQLNSKSNEAAAVELAEFHKKHSNVTYSNLNIPNYWAPMVLSNVETMVWKFPQVKFGSILEDKGALRLYITPTHKRLEDMKFSLYNDIDELILDSLDRFVRSKDKPAFL
jgi:hypothetical protein